MSISLDKYVDIISGVGGGNVVRLRDLIGRFISSNILISPDTVLEFTGSQMAANVGLYFGTSSTEYKRAVAYAGYVSPTISAPKKISFSRWSEAGNGANIIGNADPKLLATYTSVTAGTFNISLNEATPVVIGPVNLSGAASLAAVAALIQTAVQAAGGLFAAATVVYNIDRPNSFSIKFPAGQLGTIKAASVTTGVQDVGVKLGITTAANALNISGIAAQTALDAFTKSDSISDNFGSFAFIDNIDQAETVSVAAANKALNVKFMFAHRTNAASASALAAATLAYGGIALTLVSDALPDEYPDQFPMAIMAATDYNARNSTQNYMYKSIAGLTPLVTDDAAAALYDNLRINYYGQTATAGVKYSFYQDGVMMGLATDPVDMNVYANEIWLKDYCATQCLSLQLSVGRIPANNDGKGQVLNVLQGPIDAALRNGVISVGKTLTNLQKIYIADQTGNSLAWYDVQNIGYVLTAEIQQYTTPANTVAYKIVYTLIYSKDDAIRKIEGTHNLI